MMLWKLSRLMAATVLTSGALHFHALALIPSSWSPYVSTAVAQPTRTKGVAAFASRKVELAVTASSSASNDDGVHPMKDALQSMRACYRACFFATAVDVTTTLIDGKMWSKLLGLNSLFNLRWTDYVDIFDSMSLLIFALGLHRVYKFYERGAQGEDSRRDDESLAPFFSVMSWMWRFVALNFALQSLADASALPQMSVKWLGLHHISSTSVVATVATTILIGYSVINSVCERIARLEDEKDNNRISLSQRESKVQAHFKPIRSLGYSAFLGQALCAASLGINSCIKLAKWLVAADTGIVGRATSFKEWAEPFGIASLLIGLNKAFLRAAIVRSRDESRETAKMDREIYFDLFDAQVKFYSKVAEFIKGIAIFQLSSDLVAPYVTAAVKHAAPKLFDR